MGRIKTTFIKRKTKELLNAFEERFTTNFEENKKLVAQLTTVSSKKLRNIIAGYLTRLKKKRANI